MFGYEEIIIEKCPNCKDPDPAINPMPDGSCGVCAGTGKIIWKPVGEIKDVAPKLKD
jgi:hypothetical protein